MREQRGAQDATIDNYDILIRILLEQLGSNREELNAQCLRQCFLRYSDGKGHASIKHCAAALRMFERFLITEGRCPLGLEAAISLIPHWRFSSFPQYLQPEDVERIVASCARSTEASTRNRAILLLLARLGLRASDIVQLRLDNVDWKSGWVLVSGKSRRQTRLPLSQEVGDALVAYLQERRPQTDSDRVFVCCRAPFRPFASHSTVSVIVNQPIRRADITPPRRGAAHLLRHSVATALLRQGTPLQEIAVLLRHRSNRHTQSLRQSRRCDVPPDRPAVAGGAAMLISAVESYIAMRRVCGFAFKSEGTCLRGFAAYSDARGLHFVRADIAVQWARQARSACQRARRLGHAI